MSGNKELKDSKTTNTAKKAKKQVQEATKLAKYISDIQNAKSGGEKLGAIYSPGKII